MKQHSKRLLSVLLALALVLSLFPGVALTASAADDIEFVQITSTPTEDDLANMINYDQTAALALYNSAEFQALASASGGVALIYNNSGGEDGEYMVIHNVQGEPEAISTSLATIGMLIQFGSNVYIAQRSGSVTPPTPTNPAVYYRYYTLDTSSRTVSAAVSSTTDYTLVSTGDANGSWDGGWHVVNGNVELKGKVNLTGTVYLILCDGASLTVTKGLYSETSGTRLIIYPGVMSSGTRSAPEIQGTGTLTATGTQGMSAIGYELSLEVHGGVIEANGDMYAAGIGGIAGSDGCDVVIYDGTVNATGGTNAAGIGGGIIGNGGNVEIYGGTVNAVGGADAVGIGAGADFGAGAGIGAGAGGSGGNVEIYGGTVNAVSGADDVAGIGAGVAGSDQGTLSLYNTELSVSNDGETWTPASDSSVRGRYMRVQAIDLSAPVSADAGYTDGFEGANTWTLQNGDLTNVWAVGSAVNNGGSKALYISKDGGANNAYDNGESAFVFAEKRFRFEGGYYDFAYDWRNNGEYNYDYLRVALIPESAEVGPDTSPYSGFGNSTLPGGWIALDGGSQLSNQNDWQHKSVVGQSVPEGVYRVAFLWRNDDSYGNNPPAAIDNFSVAVSDYEPPAAVSADAGYTEDFEGENTWILQNGGLINAWVVGSAVSNGGSKALYISKDSGATNQYDIGAPAFVFAEKRFRFDGGNYNFEYDWHSNGEVFNSTHYDFLRVALVPDAFSMTAGTSIPSGFNASNLPSGWIALDGGSQLNLNSEWQHASFENIEVPAGVYRVAFLWRNDGSGGSNPPAAVDNFSVVNPNAPQAVPVSSVTVSPDALNLSAGDTATLAAEVLPAEADQTVVWTSSDPSVATVDDYGVVTAVGPGTATITATATNGTDNTSDDAAASCAVTVAAPIPPAAVSADAGYTEDFEGANTWTLQNGDRTNAWYVGEAVNNGGNRALYISNDKGVSNAYDTDESAFVFAEKRFRFDGGDYDFAYDWRNNGENGYDFLRVALIPDSAEVGPGTYYTGFGNSALPSGWIDLDGGFQLRIQNNWQHMSVVGKSVPEGVYRVAFLWRNDSGGGSNPPAAVDNFSVVPSGSTAVPVSSVTVIPDALSLSVDDTAMLAAEVLPAEADQTVVWTSSDPSVATVDDNGVVTAVGPGNAEITVTATNGTEDASDDVAASCTVTVAAPVAPEREVISHSFLWSWEGEPAATLRLEWSDGVLEEISMDVTPSEAQGVITYTATAEKDGTTYTSEKTVQRTYTVTVEGGSITSGEKDGYSYGDKIIVTAGPAPDGMAFAGWYIDGVLVSTAEVYGRAVDRDLELVARYDEQPVVVRPTVTASNTQRTASGDGYKTTLTVSWSVPKGYTMVEAGIYRAYANNQPSQATLVSKGSKKASTLKKANGVYNLSITIGAAKKDYGLYYVGYVTYKNARGETLTEYSTIGCSAPVE